MMNFVMVILSYLCIIHVCMFLVYTDVCNNGDVRLCDSADYCGPDVIEGRIEFCLNEVWGTICSNSWSVSDAKVACIQLGFSINGN